MLKFATIGLFLYKHGLFRQVDGVAMGSLIDPSFANFFLGHLERYKFFHNLDIYPKLYVRYVDDIFALFQNPSHVVEFHYFLNIQHYNLAFTREDGNNILPFFDVAVRVENLNLTTSIFRKKTNTGFQGSSK